MKALLITRSMTEKGARALYRKSGWDRRWKDLAPEGRKRFRDAALTAIVAAIPNAVRKVGR